MAPARLRSRFYPPSLEKDLQYSGVRRFESSNSSLWWSFSLQYIILLLGVILISLGPCSPSNMLWRQQNDSFRIESTYLDYVFQLTLIRGWSDYLDIGQMLACWLEAPRAFLPELGWKDASAFLNDQTRTMAPSAFSSHLLLLLQNQTFLAS